VLTIFVGRGWDCLLFRRHPGHPGKVEGGRSGRVVSCLNTNSERADNLGAGWREGLDGRLGYWASVLVCGDGAVLRICCTSGCGVCLPAPVPRARISLPANWSLECGNLYKTTGLPFSSGLSVFNYNHCAREKKLDVLLLMMLPRHVAWRPFDPVASFSPHLRVAFVRSQSQCSKTSALSTCGSLLN
jgi:hypothetical protein